MPFDKERAARQADPVLAEFYGGTGCPTQGQIDFLIHRHGVPALALAQDADGNGIALGAADIVFDGERLFDFHDGAADVEAVAALIFVARNCSGDPLDLAAWAPRSDRVATHFGRAPILGEHSLHVPRFGEPVVVHRDVLAWLRAERDGIVIVDAARAGRILIDAPDRLLAQDETHAKEIAALMTATVDLGRIVIPSKRAAAA